MVDGSGRYVICGPSDSDELTCTTCTYMYISTISSSKIIAVLLFTIQAFLSTGIAQTNCPKSPGPNSNFYAQEKSTPSSVRIYFQNSTKWMKGQSELKSR